MVKLGVGMVIEELHSCLHAKLLAPDHGLPLEGRGPAALPHGGNRAGREGKYICHPSCCFCRKQKDNNVSVVCPENQSKRKITGLCIFL